MSGWLWVLVGLLAWCALAVVAAFWLSAVIRGAERHQRRRGRAEVGPSVERRDEPDWPAAG
jgi:hypothetical protein